MTGRRRTSRALGAREVRESNPAAEPHGGAAVSSDLPPVSSRMNTSYGSPLSTRLRNPRRGQRRDIVSAVSAILTGGDDDDDDDEDGPRVTGREPEPEPELERKSPESDPESESDSQSESGSRPPPRRSGRSNVAAISTSHAPPSRSIKPDVRAQAVKSGASLEKRTESTPAGTPSRFRKRRSGSEEPTAPVTKAAQSRPRHGSEPPLAPTPDSTRTFGQESSIYGVATFPSTPLSESHVTVSPRTRLGASRLQSRILTITEETEEELPAVRQIEPRPVFNPRPTPGTKANAPPEASDDDIEEDELPIRRSPKPHNRASFAASSQNPLPVVARIASPTPSSSVSPIGETSENSSDELPPSNHQKHRFPGIGPPFDSATYKQGNGRRQSTDSDPQAQRRDPRTQETIRKEVVEYWTNQAARERRWGWLYRLFPRRQTVQEDGEPASASGRGTEHDFTQTGRSRSIAWARALGSFLYRALVRVVDMIDSLSSPVAWLISCGAIAAALAVVVMSWQGSSDLSGSRGLGTGAVHWYGWGDISSNLGQFVPFWLSQPSSIFSDEDAREYQKQLREYEYELQKLQRSTKLHDSSLAKLQSIVPSIVHMTLDKRGKPVINQEFYHALRDLMKDDPEVLTLSRGHHGYYYISDENWKAVRDRLRKDPSYQSTTSPNKSSLPLSDIADIVKSTIGSSINSSFKNWVKHNNDEVARILQPVVGQAIPDKLEKELKAEFNKFIKEQYDKKSTTEVVVTREEFIRHLKSEFSAHRNEVTAEMQELQAELERLVKESLQTAKKAPPPGMTRDEVSQIVDTAVRKAIANAPLRAMADGKIGANWNAELRHQVNFFSRGTGAVIDDKHTTPNFDPPIRGKVRSKEWKKSLQHPPSSPAIAALLRWEDDGECWCGATANDRHGLPLGTSLGVLLGHTVIPQHVVIEHILPGATLDEKARPKDVEVWAYVEELGLRNRVADFSETHFPDNGRQIGQHTYGDGWVKIGQFTYETSDAQNGVHVHKLDSELTTMGVVTDHIILRAVTNYGSEDHTCFYRVRLYGELKEIE